MDCIKSELSVDLAKKILANKKNVGTYLLCLNEIEPISLRIFKTISKGKNKGKKVLKANEEESYKAVVDSWDYEQSKEIIREIFRTTDKYKSGKEADIAMDILIEEWKTLELGNIAWPFSQGNFDAFVQKINSEEENGVLKDKKVKAAAVMYRRIKEINTLRNDFIETLIFEKSNNILPTLKHIHGVDFFIDGVPYDQKVARSPTKEFEQEAGDNWREVAIKNPNCVAEYLYKYQDEGRFGSAPRLLVVYIDEDVSIDRIKEIINKTDLDNPIKIEFTYEHKNHGEKSYEVSCFVILLHN